MDNKKNINKCGLISCDKLDRVANWVGSNVASAFFASLKRCSCINLNTTDNDDDNNNDARPLMLSHLPEAPTTTHTHSSTSITN